MEEETDLVPRRPHRKSMNIQSKSKKRKASDVDLRNSAYFKICGIVGQLRPQFMEVLRTPDFRNCEAAHEIRKRMMLVMDLYKHMQIEGRQPHKLLDGPQKKKAQQETSDDHLRLQGTYIVGGSVSGWNFITFVNRRPPVYYGVTKDSFRLSPLTSVQGIGVNYGLLGDNLPPPDQVIPLLKSRNINKIRIFDPNPSVLNALHDSGIEVVLGVRNQDLQQLANDAVFAQTWVSNNVVPHASSVRFTYVTAGNEVIPGPLDTYVLGAMQNLDSALKSANLPVPVSTVVSLQVLGSSYPPSKGVFADNVLSIITPIVQFLAAKQSPLLVNVYPYFAYNSDPANVKLDYALFKDTAQGFSDGSSSYNNLFDAMVDATYSALEKVEGGGLVDIVVAETGWPSAGNGDVTTFENAQTYINSLIDHVACDRGTPKRPGKQLETYIFGLFNEDLKPPGTEQNFGLFHPDMTEVYHVNFSA